MIVSVTGTVESVREFEKNKVRTTEVVINQVGEMKKGKVKIAGSVPSDIRLGEEKTFTGRYMAGVYEGKIYEFVKVG